MRIVEVRRYEKTLALAAPYNMSTSPVGEPSTTIVELVTDSRLVGWGEVCPTGPLAQPEHAGSIRADLALLAPALVGLDPTLIGQVWSTMTATMDGGIGAKSAIDIACWDLLGKATGRRVCDLLGGPILDPVPTYHVLPIGRPQAAADLAVSLRDDGLTKLQLKAGGRPVVDDIAAIRAVAAALDTTGVELFVDANRGWTVAEAIQVSTATSDLRLSLEQPCPSYHECAIARPQLHHPLILDESATDLATIARAIATGVADGLGMKLTRIGGITGMRAVRDLCLATNTPTSFDDSWGGDIIAAACVHSGSTMPTRLNRGAWISDPYQLEHYDEPNGPRIVDGHISLPSGPGLGIEIAEGYFGDPL